MEDVPQTTQEKETQPQVEKTEEKKTKETTIQTEPSAIEQGQEILDGIKIQREELEKLVVRQEEVAARMMLGGKAIVGEPDKTEEETQQEELDKQIKDSVNSFA